MKTYMSMAAGAIVSGAVLWAASSAMLNTGIAKADSPDDAAAQQGPSQGKPNLMAGLLATEGCLGVDAGQMASGKNVIFAWFEDKEAALRWYHSEMHMQVAARFFPDFEPGEREPMADVPDNVPLLVIASLTPATEAQLRETNLPVAQIAIEIYAPVSGGLHIGGRFAPDLLDVPNMRDFTLRGG